MTPSEITLYEDDINSYKAYTLDSFARFANVVANELKESVNTRHIEFNKQKLQLAEAYVQIMLDYFTETIDGDVNFFDYTEFEDIQRHLNKLLNNLYWIEL